MELFTKGRNTQGESPTVGAEVSKQSYFYMLGPNKCYDFPWVLPRSTQSTHVYKFPRCVGPNSDGDCGSQGEGGSALLLHVILLP